MEWDGRPDEEGIKLGMSREWESSQQPWEGVADGIAEQRAR